MIPAASTPVGTPSKECRPPADRPVPTSPIIIRRSIIVRVPVKPVGTPVNWVEKGSRRCMDIDMITGASIVSLEAIDLILRDGERWRLKFREECPAITFYQDRKSTRLNSSH